MKYGLMEQIAATDVTKLARRGYNWWSYQLNFKGVTMPFLPILIFVLLAGGTTTALANSAKPGDALYPLDQWMERAQTKMSLSASTRAALYAKFDAERLEELVDISNLDTTKLSAEAKAVWGEHQQEAIDHLAKSIEQVTALQLKFQEKLALAANDSEKAAFQRVLDNLARVKTRREERLKELNDQEFPGLGKLQILKKLEAWREASKDEREQIREQIKDEFENIREEAKSESETKLDDHSTSTSDDDEDDDRDDDRNDRDDEDDNQVSASAGAEVQAGVNAQALEVRVPVDENGNIRWDLYDGDHDGIPDKDDKSPDWPLHTM